ncbi:MAG: hypothetical protein ACI959_000062 [Limisphaerales bacterium]|jgi:hypothetical protein
MTAAQYTALLATLRSTVSQSFPITLGNDIVRVSTIVLEGSDDFQDALGVYLNADIQINPQNTRAEEEFIERGDVNLGISYLPFENDYAIGLPSALFNRFANHTWHQMGIDEVPFAFSHNIFDPEEFDNFIEALEDDPDTNMPDPVGVHKSISFFPSFGHLSLIAKSQFFIDFWPDADITAEFTVVPDIDDEGNLTFLSELTEFDADTGLLGDFLAFLLGGAVGLIFPPLGGLLAVGAVVALEIGENIAEDEFSDDAENAIEVDLLIDDVFSRLEDNRIATVSFTPTGVKKDSQDRITDIQFNDEVDFSIFELLFLVVNEVVAIPGYQMIRPRASAAYFRNTPDGNPDNNLDNLPEF